MKFVHYMLPYVLFSPVSVAVFFIALFVCCISVEFVMHSILYMLGLLSVVSQTAQNIFVSATGSGVSLIAAAIFLNRAVYGFRHTCTKK